MFGAIAGAAIGGLANAFGSSQNQSSTTSIDLLPQTEAGKFADKNILSDFKDIRSLFNSNSPGAQDVEAATRQQRDLASMLKQFSQGGFLPTSDDFSTANRFTNDAFAAQQTSLNQQFQDQNVQSARLAAQLGRPVNDPVLRNKMMQTQAREQALLDSQKTAASSQMAMNLPMQRLGFAAQLSDVQKDLATRAMQNRMALMSLGQSIQSNERNFRLGGASRTTTGQQSQPANFGNILNGGLAGAGIGLQGMSLWQQIQKNQQQLNTGQNFGGGPINVA